ncbi:MAG: adenylosuccinate lyase [Patescibacteria group bacterium]
MDNECEYNAISPIDGRYKGQLTKLADYFSEKALFYYRLKVEVEYLIALSNESKIKELKRFSSTEKSFLRKIYEGFSVNDVAKIKKIEDTTKHDVKAVEYYIKENIQRSKHANLKKNIEFIHFALTSEDVNNLSYSLMLKEGVKNVYLDELEGLIKNLTKKAKRDANSAMLAMTHGQPATPTTFGKELTVYVKRLARQFEQLENHKLMGKLNGATGNFAAHSIAYPSVNWFNFSKKFVEDLGLESNLFTTQIESHDSASELFDILKRINNIIIDLDQDFWMYISRNLLAQKTKRGEVGSSTMPHKTNPINFENSEGNLQLANSLLTFMGDKLMKSRMQRDLTDSTVLRNQGVVIAHSLLGVLNTVKGLDRCTVNQLKMLEELEDNPEVLAEAVQIILRKAGVDKPYEKMKQLTKGKDITLSTIRKFVENLDISVPDKKRLLSLEPEDYTGLSEKLTK